MRLAILCLLGAVGCGGDDGPGTTKDAATGDSNKPIDAALVDARVVDAPPDAQQFVKTVQCPGSPDAEVGATTGTYTPAATTISANEIVRFTMPANHNVAPHPSMPSDPGLSVGFGQTACLQFTTAGTFNFRCSAHLFVGTVTVQ